MVQRRLRPQIIAHPHILIRLRHAGLGHRVAAPTLPVSLIGYPGKIGPSGKRPRFRLTTHQTRLAGYLSEIEAALEAAGLTPAWLLQRSRAGPFSGRSPTKLIAERDGEGAAEVLQFLNRAVLRKSLR